MDELKTVNAELAEVLCSRSTDDWVGMLRGAGLVVSAAGSPQRAGSQVKGDNGLGVEAAVQGLLAIDIRLLTGLQIRDQAMKGSAAAVESALTRSTRSLPSRAGFRRACPERRSPARSG